MSHEPSNAERRKLLQSASGLALAQVALPAAAASARPKARPATSISSGRWQVRGVWDRITPTACRWRPRVSREGGKVWIEDWFMDWTRT